MNGGPIQRIVTHGTFELDGGSWEVDNNIWIVGDDNETVQALLVEYVECSAALAVQLREHLGARRAEQAAAVAHKLKSSSRSIGADRERSRSSCSMKS